MTGDRAVRLSGIWGRTVAVGLSAATVGLMALLFVGVEPAYGASYEVDTTSDSIFTACTGAPSDCSLRGAIANANANGGSDFIGFDVSVFQPSSPATISLGSALPAMAPGAGGDQISGGPGVIIDGVTDSFVCFTLDDPGSTVYRIAAVKNCGTAFLVTEPGQIGAENQPEDSGDCADGVDSDGDTYVNDGCVQVGAASETGAECTAGDSTNDDFSDDSNVNDGCPVRGEGMVIQDNADYGVRISGEAADGVLVSGNYIGTNEDGTMAEPNGTGIVIDGGADSAGIGGGLVGFRNVISGNTNDGVYIIGSGTTDTAIAGNLIGTNAAGNAALPNHHGVETDAAMGTNVGGVDAGLRNVISGNADTGVRIGNGSTGTAILGNYIGTDVSGMLDVGNANGIQLGNSDTNTVGAAAGNVISGNDSRGVLLNGGSAFSNTVSGNLIGTNAAGTSAIPNGVGIEIIESPDNNTIGGTTAAARNVVSGNTGNGIRLVDAPEAGATCLNAVDDDGNGYINDGCPQVGATAESGAQCAQNDVVNNDPGDDSVVNDGCPSQGSTTSGNVISGNYIGLNAAGTATLANGSEGVILSARASGNTVGGTNMAESACVGLADDDSDGYVNDGCVISGIAETDANCANAIDNDGDTLVNDGCPARGSGNVISGNASLGVLIDGVGANGNVVKGNIIGLGQRHVHLVNHERRRRSTYLRKRPEQCNRRFYCRRGEHDRQLRSGRCVDHRCDVEREYREGQHDRPEHGGRSPAGEQYRGEHLCAQQHHRRHCRG